MTFVECSRKWSLQLEEGISLRRVPSEALEPSNNGGEILVAAHAEQVPLTFEADKTTHVARVSQAPCACGRL